MTRLTAIAALCLVLVAGGAYWFTAGSSTPPDLPFAANAQDADVDTSSVVEMSLGNPDAPVTVIEYASFTCPHCADFHANQFKQLKANYIDSGKINFIHRDVYFDRFGLWASMVARCGGEDRYFGIIDMIYDQQKEWIGSGDAVGIADRLRKIGKVAGLDADQVDACLADQDKAKTLVAWFQQNSEEHDINSTPSLVINGEKYSNMSYQELSTIIDEKLAE
ncbi:MAG TPA: DsbA family protein [Roseovarius sp.]|nr:DsbA family protein [Roseovarius sp.]